MLLRPGALAVKFQAYFGNLSTTAELLTLLQLSPDVDNDTKVTKLVFTLKNYKKMLQFNELQHFPVFQKKI